MSWIKRILGKFHSSFANSQMDGDLDAEMASHLEMAIEENIKKGMSAEDARRQALIRFGGIEQAKQHQRNVRGFQGFDILLQDLRYTFRMLRRDPGFAAIAVLILALGIGANIAVFSVVNTILLRPLPFQDPQQLVWLAGNNGEGGLSSVTYQVPAYEAFQRSNRSFQEMTAFVPYYSLSESKLIGRGEPKPVSFVWVAGNFFQTLGVQPVLGRSFTSDESVKGGRPVVLLSYPFWQRQFAGDPNIVGKSVQFNKDVFTVVGVMPASFDFGAVFAPGMKTDFFRPVYMQDIRTWGHMLSVIGRLKPGVTVGQAQAETDTLFPQLKGDSNPYWSTDVHTTISLLKDHVSGKLHRSLIVLWCAVGLILLIVCVNLSNLLLARAATRSKEFAMRRALGAGRKRLLRQMLTESFVLSSIGAVVGLGLAFVTTSYLSHQGSLALPLLSSVKVDGTVLVWTLLIVAISAVIFGIAPALKTSDNNLHEVLKDTGPAVSEGKKHERLRSTLVVSEVALACVLLIGAGLLLRSFLHVLDVDLGFEPSHAAAIRIDYDDKGDRATRGAILQQILERVDALPGVETSGVTDMLPLDRNRSWDLAPKNAVIDKNKNYDVFVYIVTPGYLNAMGMHLRAGRDFTWGQDTPKSEPVIIINEAAARREWPGQDPIGQLAMGIGDGDTRVVGVVSDVHESSVEGASGPQVYVPTTQATPEGAELVVRSKLPPAELASSVMGTLRSLNPGQPATEFRPIQSIVDHSTSPRRFFVMLVAAFAMLGLILASLGIYGVISYSVTRRTQEIGIRMALGATTSRVQLGVINKTLQLVLLGIGIGAVASFGVARTIASLLFATQPTDPATFVGMVFLLSTVALLAGYIPARRASRINPMTALRNN